MYVSTEKKEVPESWKGFPYLYEYTQQPLVKRAIELVWNSIPDIGNTFDQFLVSVVKVGLRQLIHEIHEEVINDPR
jgi:hypothetical protein